MSHADDVFYRQFGFVLVLLVVFALIAGLLANVIGGDALSRISQSEDSVLDRIKPIGILETAAAAPKAEVPTAAVAVAADAAPSKPAAKAAEAAKPAMAAPTVAAPTVAAPTVAAAAAAPTAGAMDNGGAEGKKTYTMACMACHAAGVANAPKLGDNAAWAKRAEQGLEALYASGVKGKGQLMPAKGGNMSLSDDAVRAAVRYMLSEAGVSAK